MAKKTTPETKASVLVALSTGRVTVEQMVEATGVQRRTIQRWLKVEADAGGTVQRVVHKVSIESNEKTKDQELVGLLEDLVIDSSRAMHKLVTEVLSDVDWVKEHARDSAPLFQIVADQSNKILEGFARAGHGEEEETEPED